ncbi:hypothetical protein ACT3UJ_05885 [Halomonas sp. 86]|uniref:hypothetical protein n=1 Tax=unclassified Halomonas TaxID=2609666 RepID=UPI0040347587
MTPHNGAIVSTTGNEDELDSVKQSLYRSWGASRLPDTELQALEGSHSPLNPL